MRVAMRALVLLSLPLVAFGWLVSTLPEPPPAPSESALMFGVGAIAVLLVAAFVATPVQVGGWFSFHTLGTFWVDGPPRLVPLAEAVWL